ncbi:hypothetical protein BKA63DRAFT_561845 [Paraphoma chrysanthemicola]|nr:hypothetical protein BKA63DRAFT_561845 [Paraphoma chrysanthemicola]
MANKEDYLYIVLVHGDDRAEKKAELKALVKQTAGCDIVRELTMEGTGFWYLITNAVAHNPLEEYVDKGSDAMVEILKFEKHPWVTAEHFANIDEGAAFPDRPEYEIVDVPEAH